MARRPRGDTPGSWHHLMNRAIARRSIFETRQDIRFFLAGVARAVRRGQLEVHAWCVLTTHFHMLVRSPIGELSVAMHRIQNAYARYFNRTRRRDGPLLRGRFCSKPVKSMAYRRVLVRYIDANPVQAGLCATACEYPWGSARQYATGTGPRWLQREWLEELVAQQAGLPRFAPSAYRSICEDGGNEVLASMVQAQLDARDLDEELDSLLQMAPHAVRAWLIRKASLADGRKSQAVYVAVAAVSALVQSSTRKLGEWTIRPNRKDADGWSTLHAGLLRELAGASLAVIASRLNVSTVHANRIVERHRDLLRTDAFYGQRAAMLTWDLLDVYRDPARLHSAVRPALPVGE